MSNVELFEEVVWENVRCLPGGECVSVDGTHLGHNIPATWRNLNCNVFMSRHHDDVFVKSPRALLHVRIPESPKDSKGNRYCINLVSVAGNPPTI